jgi:hypothetical protein
MAKLDTKHWTNPSFKMTFDARRQKALMWPVNPLPIMPSKGAVDGLDIGSASETRRQTQSIRAG